MAKIVKFGKPKGFFDTFERRPGPLKKSMHYCPGCGHGILHKLIAEAIADMDLHKDLVFIAPVGCAVFTYYYFDACGISVPHGRAPAVGTGIARCNPDKLVLSYQGDGDLASIGFNELIQAANRGENILVCFVNNAVYGMTGGQMAPTTLPGQKTTTSPYGRDPLSEGYPMKVCEMVAALSSPIYVERVALTSTKNIMQARKALRKGLQYLKDKKGFSLIEFLSGCPTNLKKTAAQTDYWIENSMIPYFPLGCIKDIGEGHAAIVRPKGIYDPVIVKAALFPHKSAIGKDASFKNISDMFARILKVRCSGFGGQGVLSLGTMIAFMAQLGNFNVVWMPSYGPEMRGGTASCSLVISREPVGSPMVSDGISLLIAMNQQSLDKYLPELKGNGVLIYDSTTCAKPVNPGRRIVVGVPAAEIALKLGNLKFANSVILGALSNGIQDLLTGGDKKDFDFVFEEAIIKTFRTQKDVIELNLKAFHAGKEAAHSKNWPMPALCELP